MSTESEHDVLRYTQMPFGPTFGNTDPHIIWLGDLN